MVWHYGKTTSPIMQKKSIYIRRSKQGSYHGPLICIYRSILYWASVHVTLSVGYAAITSQWTLDIFRKFLKPLHSKF